MNPIANQDKLSKAQARILPAFLLPTEAYCATCNEAWRGKYEDILILMLTHEKAFPNHNTLFVVKGVALK